MRYVVIGAGAVGGAIGGRLAEAGHDVLLVARGKHYQAIRSDGLRLLTPDSELTLRLPVAERPDDVSLRPDDILVLAVKTQDTQAALGVWAAAPVLGGGTAAERLPVFCAQNGVENERIALRHCRLVYGVGVWLPASHLEPGVVLAEGSPKTGILNLGRYPAGVDDVVEHVVADLDRTAITGFARDDVMSWKYAKLLTNTANALEAITDRISDPAQQLLRERLLAEGIAVLAAAGIDHVRPEDERQSRQDQVQVLPVAGVERGGGSSWQSLRRGTGTIEADYLNGEIALLGRLHGVATPVNDALQRLANEFARQGRLPGSLDATQLTKIVDGSMGQASGGPSAG